ncbi:MAG: CAP domain-containing protein [Thermoflexaceae bacterium]|nr:CAP domain-containing protein [Thermoflexaceae bacterium]
MRSVSTPLAVAAGALLLALAAAGLPLPHVFPAHAITNCETSEEGLNAAELEMLALINAERAKVGAPALKVSPGLNRTAAWKSADSSAYGPGFSHRDSLGRWPSQRARDCGYPGDAAENIAYGYPSPAATVAAWMGSAGHRANILNATYVVIGLGQHGTAWTNNFGFVDDSGGTQPPPPPPPPPTATQPQPPATATATAPRPSPTATMPAPTATATQAPVYPAAGVHMELGAGVNMVTYVGAEQPAARALQSLDGVIRAVYEWNVAAGRWERYLPGRPGYVSTFTTLKPGRVYLVELTWAGTWVY